MGAKHLRINRSKILPFKKPFITSYPSMAAAVAICQTRPEQTNAWLASHFLQLVAVDKSYIPNLGVNIIDFIDDIGREGIPYHDYSVFHTYRFPRSIIVKHWRSPLNFVKEMITDGYYIRWNMDRMYVSCASEFRKNSFFHPIVIYGYDHSNLYVADFFDGAFVLEKAATQGLHKAFGVQEPPRSNESKYDYTREVALHKLREFPYRFYLEDIIRDSQDYLNSQDSTRKYITSSAHRDKIFTYGIDCYDVILKNVIVEGMNDIRPFHVLCDHKAMMEFRVTFLRENLYIHDSDADELISELKTLMEKTTSLRNYVMKSFFTKQEEREEWQENLSNTMMELKKLDAQFMENFLLGIKK